MLHVDVSHFDYNENRKNKYKIKIGKAGVYVLLYTTYM